MNKSTIILDSSVIAKWFFPENENKNALLVKTQFVSGKISIAIPLLLYYEINNILKTAVKRLRISNKDAEKVYNSFLKLNLIAYSSDLLLEKTLEVALKLDISSYDASYVALAEYLRVPFLTADKKLLIKAENKFVIDLNDYTD